MSLERTSRDWKLGVFGPTLYSLEMQLMVNRKGSIITPLVWGSENFWVGEHREVLEEHHAG